MNPKTRELLARLNASPGWQRMSKKVQEEQMPNQTTVKSAEYFVEYIGCWQGQRDQYAGPFASIEDARDAIPDLEVLLDCSFCAAGEHMLEATKDKRYRIVAASALSTDNLRDFVHFAKQYEDDDEDLLLDIHKIQNNKLRRFLGLSTIGRPSLGDNPRQEKVTLTDEHRAAIAAIRSAKPELKTDGDVIREALRVFASALNIQEHDPAILERLEEARLNALMDREDE